MSAQQPVERMETLGDDQLVDWVRAGRQTAVVALFERHSLPLLAFCRHLLGHGASAEHMVRDSFGKALAGIRRHDRPVNFKVLLFAIARNRCAASAIAPELLDTQGLDPEVRRDPELRAMLAKLGALPYDQRTVLLLVELGKHSREDISAIAGCSGDKADALLVGARTTLAGEHDPGDWACAQVRPLIATAGGELPGREALRKHVAECAGCDSFLESIRHCRRLLEIVLPVTPTDELHAPGVSAEARATSMPTAAAGGPASKGSSGTAVRAAAIVAAGGVLFAGGALAAGQATQAPTAAAGDEPFISADGGRSPAQVVHDLDTAGVKETAPAAGANPLRWAADQAARVTERS